MDEVLLNNRYRLLDLVGSGGMAVVYRAVDTLLQREVAVKVLREAYAGDPAFLARFRREAQAAANLQHPNIVTVYDVGQDGDRYYIVMEYVVGQDLKGLIRQRGRLSVAEAVDIAIQVSSGTGHAHRSGVVHCDVKPQNVLVTADGWAKVTDFGISRALSELALTESETVWGSPIYFSPEQAAGEPPSPASDVYSIGVVLYEMLAGTPPFQADKSAALALMHLHEEPPPLVSENPQVPPQLARIVGTSLAKEAVERYPAGDDLAFMLDQYQMGSAQETGPHPVPVGAPDAAATADASPDPRGPFREHLDRTSLALGVIALVAVVGLIPLWLFVYREYSASAQVPVTPSPLPSVAPTDGPEVATVPNLVGRTAEEATATLRSLGIGYSTAEREVSDGGAGLVLEQEPTGGAQIPPDAEVKLVVGVEPRQFAMPEAVGHSTDAARASLESDGLNVEIGYVWSGEPEGRVLDQDPPAGANLQAGDTVRLVASGGTSEPINLQVRFGDLYTLQSAGLANAVYRPGDDLVLDLRWLAHQQTDARYKVFVHLIDSDGHLVTQKDEEPTPPTSLWVANQVVDDRRVVVVPGDAVSGPAQVRVGMYPLGQPASRLPVTDPGLTVAEANSILVAEIEISP